MIHNISQPLLQSIQRVLKEQQLIAFDPCRSDNTSRWFVQDGTLAFNAGGFYVLSYVASTQQLVLTDNLLRPLKSTDSIILEFAVRAGGGGSSETVWGLVADGVGGGSNSNPVKVNTTTKWASHRLIFDNPTSDPARKYPGLFFNISAGEEIHLRNFRVYTS